MKRTIIGVILVLCLFAFTAFAAEKSLMMATTTSTDNTGILDYLAPAFLQATGIELKWVAVGTGKTLALGQNCDVDVLFVHAPDAEKKYIADGYGLNRREIMYNDFIIIGAASDPANIKGKTVSEALTAIRNKQAVFASRGDDSGTHKLELSLWKTLTSPVPEKESWYVQTGQGMLSTINIAAERGGYTITDRGTYIKYESNMKGNPPLVILLEGDAVLLNQYSVIAVNPEKCKNARYDLAMKFSDWIASEAGQKLIRDFKLLEKQLFFPNAK